MYVFQSSNMSSKKKQPDRRDECIISKLLMLLGVHAGERTCRDVMRDEEPFVPVTPYSAVYARDVEHLAVRQGRFFTDALRLLFGYAQFLNYKPGTCWQFGEEYLPEDVKAACLVVSHEGKRHIFAITDDSYIMFEEQGKLHAVRKDGELPDCFKNSLQLIQAA